MAVPTFTAEAALTPADARVARAFAMPRPADAQGAAAAGEPCDLWRPLCRWSASPRGAPELVQRSPVP